jgi:hypothetical protein
MRLGEGSEATLAEGLEDHSLSVKDHVKLPVPYSRHFYFYPAVQAYRVERPEHLRSIWVKMSHVSAHSCWCVLVILH